jgi:integrase
VLLGSEAGLHRGEMIPLEWRDVDLGTRQLRIERSDWNGKVTTTKGGRLRYMHLSPAALDAAIQRLDGRGHSGWPRSIVATAMASAGEIGKA